jgi:hypothetical protein
MSAAQSAEAQLRLQFSLKDLISFFEKAGVSSQSIENLQEFVTKNQTMAFLELAEAFGECMAFIDHDDVLIKIQGSFHLLAEGYNIERKLIVKRLKFLREDKKSDPSLIEKNENGLVDIDQRKALVLVQCLRLRAMLTIPIKHFKENPNFDCIAHYNKIKEHRRNLFATPNVSSKT